MNPLSRLHRRWNALAPRERRLALTGLIVLLPVAAHLYLWQPLMAKWHRLQDEVARLDAQMRQIEADLAQIGRLRRLPATTPASLDQLLAQAPAGASLARLGPDRAELRWAEVEAGPWLAWVAESASRGLRIERCELAPAASGGLSVEMTVTRSS